MATHRSDVSVRFTAPGARAPMDAGPAQPRGVDTRAAALGVPVSGYVDHDAASTLNACSLAGGAVTSHSVTALAATGYVDYDVAESVRGPAGRRTLLP